MKILNKKIESDGSMCKCTIATDKAITSIEAENFQKSLFHKHPAGYGFFTFRCTQLDTNLWVSTWNCYKSC